MQSAVVGQRVIPAQPEFSAGTRYPVSRRRRIASRSARTTWRACARSSGPVLTPCKVIASRRPERNQVVQKRSPVLVVNALVSRRDRLVLPEVRVLVTEDVVRGGEDVIDGRGPRGGVAFGCLAVAGADEDGSDAEELGGAEIEAGVADDP
jgi:hypothetical protein